MQLSLGSEGMLVGVLLAGPPAQAQPVREQILVPSCWATKTHLWSVFLGISLL